MRVLYWVREIGTRAHEDNMLERTCAACDCELDENTIEVTIGGKTVEVCCAECAQKLKEAIAAPASPKSGSQR